MATFGQAANVGDVPRVAPVQPGAARRPGLGLPDPSMTGSVGGTMSFQSLGAVTAAKKAKADLDSTVAEQQQQPGIVGLAAHIKSFFVLAEQAKQDVKDEMLEALYARRGAYTPAKMAQIAAAGQPPIYMMLAATKMRQAESLFRDTLIGAGTEKPWSLMPRRVPELPPEEVSRIKQEITTELTNAIQMGLEPTMEAVRDRMQAAKAELQNTLQQVAREHMERMEDKMETQLSDGGFDEALDEFITDLTTYKTAFIAGPIVRNKPQLTWGPGGQPTVVTQLMLEWERVDPFDIYPAPWAKSMRDGAPLVRKHRLSRENLSELRGVEGYSDEAIQKVLELYGQNGLTDWLAVDSQVALAEGKTTVNATTSTGLMDTLQYWGSVSGQMLREWGMTAKDVPDTSKEYQVEAWMIGHIVIKAVLNADPLARRPLYGTSYERIPGSVWGRSLYDLMTDCQGMCNAAARALAANLGIASGPQVGVDVSRMPAGEDVTNLYPWKVWQFEADPMGSTAAPLIFFQPDSHAAELMGVFEKFSVLADEYTGIPRYMAGTEGTPGAGRTASGLSMMIGNASKIIKQIIGAVDDNILEPILDRLYYYNMRYGTDPDLKGDVKCVARGAMSLQTKEAAQVRLNEVLAATNNPTDLQIIGLPGRAELLRSAIKRLDINPDKVVPPVAILQDKQKQAQAQQAQAAGPQQGTPPSSPTPASGGGGPSPSGQALMNSAPQTDHFQPSAQPAAG